MTDIQTTAPRERQSRPAAVRAATRRAKLRKELSTKHSEMATGAFCLVSALGGATGAKNKSGDR